MQEESVKQVKPKKIRSNIAEHKGTDEPKPEPKRRGKKKVEEDVPPQPAPKKEKKKLSEKQIEALKKGQELIKAKREAKKKSTIQ